MTRLSSHDHGNCALCDQLDAEHAALERERDEARALLRIGRHAIFGDARQHGKTILDLYNVWLDQADAAEARGLERGERKCWWLHHACPPEARYGDDGEMQCGACLLDFKRADLLVIQATLAAQARAVEA